MRFSVMLWMGLILLSSAQLAWGQPGPAAASPPQTAAQAAIQQVESPTPPSPASQPEEAHPSVPYFQDWKAGDWINLGLLLTSLGALGTAIGTLLFTWAQVQHMRQEAEREQRHRELSVEPQLIIYTNSMGGALIAINLESTGVGPAVIEKMEYFWQQQPISYKELTKVLGEECQKTSPTVLIDQFGIVEGAFIPAGQDFALFEWSARQQEALKNSDSFLEVQKRVGQILSQVVIRITYQNSYRKYIGVTQQGLLPKSTTPTPNAP